MADITYKLKNGDTYILSPYTIAENCTDETDIMYGITELQGVMKHHTEYNKKIPAFIMKRFNALCFDLYIKYKK